MIQVRHFELSKWKECNEFMKTTRPRGEKGFIANASGFVVVYEDGMPMDKLDKLAKLKFALGKHQENALDYTKELLINEEMEKEFLARPDEKEYDKKQFTKNNEIQKNAKNKMIELEMLSVKATEALIKKIEKE